jgi:DNA repair exonuclease SbcCD ATPase subunit
MSNEIQNFRQAVEKFDELLVDLETVEKRLSENFSNYKTISEISKESTERFIDALKELNDMRLAVGSTLKSLRGLHDKIESSNAEINRKLKSSFTNLASEIDSVVQDAIKAVHIDAKEIEKIIDEKLVKSVNTLIDKLDSDIDSVTNDIDRVVVEAKDTAKWARATIKQSEQESKLIRKKADDLADALAEFDKIRKTRILGWFGGGVLAGAIIAAAILTFFKIDAISDYYFSSYEKRLSDLQKQNQAVAAEVARLRGLSRFLHDHNVKVGYGLFSDTKEPFLSLRLREKPWKDKESWIIPLPAK